MGAGQISFGPFVLDRSAQTLLSSGKSVALGQRAFALLEALAIADGSVDKGTLIEAAWPGTIVEEGNLTVQIAALRKALGTRADGSEWIVTVPRLGYRLMREGPGAPASSRHLPRLAVLPFQNLSSDPEQEYFADGAVEDIITALTRVRSFTIIARHSTFVFKGRAVDIRQVASELGADYVLEGSVRRGGNKVRLTAQLVDGSTGAQLWAHSFDGTLDDIFDMQDRVTSSVAAAIEPGIDKAEKLRSLRERPGSTAVYDLYLRAMEKLGSLRPEHSADGLRLLDQVIALDPDFTKAVAMAAWGYEYRLHMGLPPLGADDMEKCLKLARHALAHADDDAVVIAHCGVILQLCAHEWEQGLRTIERAVSINPMMVATQFFGGVGHLKGGSLDQALVYFQRAIELDPGHGENALAGIGHVHLSRGDFEAALEWGARALAADSNFGWPHWLPIAANAHLGHLDEARYALERYREIFPDATLSRIRIGQAMREPQRAALLIDGLHLAGLPE